MWLHNQPGQWKNMGGEEKDRRLSGVATHNAFAGLMSQKA
jgi:hypothetical protein